MVIYPNIRIDYQCILGEIISKVHFNTPGTPKKYSAIPPLIKLDMMIHMYFPSLTKAHNQFVSTAEPFGKKWAENISTSFISEPIEIKQRICGEYVNLFKELDCEISNLQQQLASMVKA